MAEMMLNIGANVNDAVQGLGFVADRTKQLQTQIEYLRGKLADTKSEKFYANALGIIAQKQTELNRISKATGEQFNKLSGSGNRATQSLTDLSRIAQDAPYGFIGIANNINPLIESFGRLKASTGSTGGAFKALLAGLSGPAGLGLAVGVASSLLVAFGDKLFGASEASKKLADEQKKLAEEQKAVVSGMARENSEVSILVGQLQKENLSREQKTALLNKLKQINPTYFGDLKNEAGLVDTLNIAYGKYLASLVRRTEAELLTKDLEKLSTTILELERKGAVRTSLLPKGVGFDENRKITNENLKQLGLSRELEDSLKERDALLKRILEKSDIPVDTKKAVQSQQNLITRAKALAKELEKIGAIVPDFSALQTEAQQTKIAQAFIKQFENVKIKFKVEVDEKAIDVPNLVGDGALRTEAEKQAERDGAILGKAFIDGRNKVLTTGFILTPEAIKLRNLAAAEEQTKQLGQSLANSFNQGFSNAISSGLQAVGEGIGNLLSGENFGGSILQVLSGLLSSIGQALISYGIIKGGLDKILGAGGIAIPGTVALALGAAAIASAQIVKNFGGAREKGGPVSGNQTYLVGERGPELFVPSVGGSIIPNNRMTSFSGRPSMASSGGGRSIVRGNDILLAYARTSRSQNRVNA